MTQEDKELLLKDLCARLPYEVKCIVTKSRTEEGQKGDVGKIVCMCLEGVDCIGTSNFFSEFGNFKPYLFPISSMTDEQKEEWRGIRWSKLPWDELNWLNEGHWDYRHLIEKELALDATGLNIY